VLYPARVQGKGAAEEVAEGIEAFNKLKSVDVIIVGRGGGSLEDLWAFNEEIVARAIYNSELPIVSAVGHEIDFTIADFVSDLRAPTPSAAAEIVIQRKEDIIYNIEHLTQKLRSALNSKVDMIRKHLDGIMQRYAFKQPGFLVEQHQQRIDEYTKVLSQGLTHLIEIRQEKTANATGRLKALSPTAILSRGYSITMSSEGGRILKDATKIPKATRIRTKLAKGEIVSKVE